MRGIWLFYQFLGRWSIPRAFSVRGKPIFPLEMLTMIDKIDNIPNHQGVGAAGD
jgi:hypothetical protein